MTYAELVHRQNQIVVNEILIVIFIFVGDQTLRWISVRLHIADICGMKQQTANNNIVVHLSSSIISIGIIHPLLMPKYQ